MLDWRCFVQLLAVRLDTTIDKIYQTAWRIVG